MEADDGINNRQSHRKPSDELYKHFKANFPQVTSQALPESSDAAQSATPLATSLDVVATSQYVVSHRTHARHRFLAWHVLTVKSE